MSSSVPAHVFCKVCHFGTCTFLYTDYLHWGCESILGLSSNGNVMSGGAKPLGCADAVPLTTAWGAARPRPRVGRKHRLMTARGFWALGANCSEPHRRLRSPSDAGANR